MRGYTEARAVTLRVEIVGLLSQEGLKQSLQGDVSIEPFRDRFENQIAGWTATMDVIIENDVNVC